MYTSLYYPHATIRSEAVIKNALLLWDNLEFIAPWEDFEDNREIWGEIGRNLN